jgi:hypothetical protein
MVCCRAARPVIAAMTAAAGQATSRQRGDSSRPVGNSSGVNTSVRARVGYQAQEANQAARTGPGRWRAEAKMAYSSARAPRTASRAMAANIQPTAFPGRCLTISAPTTTKLANASSSGTESVKASGLKVPLTAASVTSTATTAVQTASRDQATQVERLTPAAPRRLLGCSPSPPS